METSEKQDEDALADKVEQAILAAHGDRRMTPEELKKLLDSLKITWPNKDTNT